MSESSTEATEVADVTPDGDIATPDAEAPVSDGTPSPDLESEQQDQFPREVVEKLRAENAKYRQRAQLADDLAQRLHLEMVRATGRLADPSDLAFSEDHLADPAALTAAVDELLEAKPHLASRKPVGDIGQGARGGSSQETSLLQILRGMT